MCPYKVVYFALVTLNYCISEVERGEILLQGRCRFLIQYLFAIEHQLLQ